MSSEPPSVVSRGTRFCGPVFVVGMPRSGTKLLRDLLRGHSRIRIPPVETNILPRWVAEWARFGDLSDPERFSAFYRWNLRAPYFLYRSRQRRGAIPEEVWYAGCRTFDPEGVFEALIRHEVDAPPGSGLLWGDKSPDYVRHIDLLSRVFPQARFLHIVRDARDHCLSLMRRNSTNPARAAQRWAEGVAKARRDGDRIPARYLEVRYEDLLADPERELRRSSEFLDLEFEEGMLTLRFSTEGTGDARGAHEVVADNVRKYVTAMEPGTIRRIEEIAGPELRQFGYEVSYAGPVRRVPGRLMTGYRLLDAVNYARVRGRRIGLRRHLQLQLGRFTRS